VRYLNFRNNNNNNLQAVCVHKV